VIYDQLVSVLAQRKKIEDLYGPLEQISEEEVESGSVNQAFIWTVRSAELDSFMSNGLIACGDLLEMYYRSAQPCLEPADTVTAVDVIGLDCDACDDLEDPEDCLSCQGSLSIFIDIQEIIKRDSIDFSSGEQIWGQRVPGGTFGEVCVPADYENSAHSRSLPKPPWLS
jgi:hypothetical protein